MSQAGIDSQHQLPLVPFERYILADDRPGYPMTFLLRIEFEGIPDRVRLEDAFHGMLNRHPLLSVRHDARQRKWIETNPPVLNWFVDGSPPSRIRQPIDLSRQAGLVADVRVTGERGMMTFLFHHAVCDGIGGLQIVGDLLAEYARRSDAASSMELPPLDPRLLSQRGRFDIELPHSIPISAMVLGLAKEAWKVLSRRPVPLRGDRSAESVDEPGLTVVHLSEDLRQRLRNRATNLGVTTNDLLLRDMFLTLQEWNRGRGHRNRKSGLRINMPTSLRGRRDVLMPATNLLGYTMLTRRMVDCDDPAALLTSLAEETSIVRKWGLASTFVAAIAGLDLIPGLLRSVVRSSRQFATLVLSNLGDPVHRFSSRLPQSAAGEILAGNLKITQLYGVPPIRPGTRAAVMISTYAGRLAIAVNADPRWFDARSTSQFLDLFRRYVEESAGVEVSPPCERMHSEPAS